MIIKIIGAGKLDIKISPVPLDRERAGIDILSKGIWHDTTLGSIEGDVAKRIFGEIDVPVLEERYDKEDIPPFDNTRNMTLNQSNPVVVTLLAWIDQCLQKVAHELTELEKERRLDDESRKLQKQARELEKLLNNDFKGLQMILEKVRREYHVQGSDGREDIVPGEGTEQSNYVQGGPIVGDGTKGSTVNSGEEERPGNSLLDGTESGIIGRVIEHKQRQALFHIEYRHETKDAYRSHYERDIRTITINVDHPQIAHTMSETGGIEGKQFKEITYEIASVEYAIALGHERMLKDEFYSGSEAMFDIRETINRISRNI